MVAAPDAPPDSESADLPVVTALGVNLADGPSTADLSTRLVQLRGGVANEYASMLSIDTNDAFGVRISATGSDRNMLPGLANDAADVWVSIFNETVDPPSQPQFRARVKHYADN